MVTMVCPSFSPLPLKIVMQAWVSRPPPKRGDHWLVQFHCNCEDDDDDDDDKELMISRPDISICSCIVTVFLARAVCISLFIMDVTKGKPINMLCQEGVVCPPVREK